MEDFDKTIFGKALKEALKDERIQYDSIESAKEAFADIYSFNIESELYPQLNEKLQELWRKEIEYAVIAGVDYGLELSKDERYEKV